jgi:hypothetical protein
MKRKLFCLKDRLTHVIATLVLVILFNPAFAQYPAGSPVAINGKIKVVGTNLTNECGVPIQLRGMSSHGLQWYSGCANSSSLDVLTNTWGIDIFRLAMYVQEGGYVNNPSYWKTQIDNYVDLCGQKGIYCLIDWHVLNPGDPNANIVESRDFWTYMATKHGGKKHVIYEICNEPNGVSWSTVKTYATDIIAKIRAIDPATIIVVGTPNYSQDVDVASYDKLAGTNIMYTLHFYSGSHSGSLRAKGSTAIANGAAVFVTEWGTSQASGSGGTYLAEADNWMTWLNQNKLSWCNWSFSDDNGTSSALNGGSCGGSNWSNLSTSGVYVKGKFTSSPHSFPACGSSSQQIALTQGTIPVSNGGTYDFANTISSGSKAITFTITNTGSQALNLTGTPKVSVSGTNASQFVVTTQPAASTLALNATTTFTITFTPGTTGAKTASFTVVSNDTKNSPYTVSLTGTGTLNATSPKIGITQGTTVMSNGGAAFSIGSTTAGSKNTKAFTISNTGDNAMNISGITVAGTGYSIIPPIPTTIAIGGSATVWVQYTSTSTTTGSPAGSFTVANDDVTNANFVVNLTTNVVGCAAVATSDNIQDWDANASNSINIDTWNTNWVDVNKVNPAPNSVNPSYYVAQYTKTTGTTPYDGVKFNLCGTNTINFTATKSMISMLVYSPAPGIPVQINVLTNADVANTTTYPNSGSASVSTTKTGWERLYFDFSSAIGKAGLTYIGISLDPKVTKPGAVYYVDDIKLDMPTCSDLPTSGVLIDYDTHINMSFAFTPNDAATEYFTNPSLVAPNTSAKCLQWIRNAPTGTAATDNYHLVRYKVCGNYLNLNTSFGSIISMAIYSPKAGIPVLISLKDGTAPNPVEVAGMTVKTTKAGAWEILTFDFTSVKTSTAIKAVDIFIDPLSSNTATVAARTYLIDEIKLTTVLPCIANIVSTRVLNDFDANRNVDLAFAPTGTWNDGTPNPSATGINTSATVAAYGRPATATADVIRFAACGSNFSLTAGKTLFSLWFYSPKPSVQVTLSCKDKTSTSLLDVNVVSSAVVNGWQELTFDCSAIANSSAVTALDILVDPNNANGATTYYLDNFKYSDLPRMSVAYNTSIITNGTTTPFKMGNISVGSSSSTLTFSITNTGLNNLNLTGTTAKISILGSNAADFVVDETKTTSPIANVATTFTLTFKPSVSGPRYATVSIANDDPSASPYTFTVNGLGIVPSMTIKQGTTPIASGTGAYDFGSVKTTTSSAAITFKIQNFGTDTLRLTGTPVIAISGANATDFTITQPAKTKMDTASATNFTTFTVTFAPGALGVRNAMISIANNDPLKNPFSFALKGTGSTVTGISDNTNSEAVVNFPSPFNDETTIKIDAVVKSSLSVKVLDITGKSVYEAANLQTNEYFTLGKDLAPGIYMVHMVYGTQARVLKIVKQ